MGNQNPYIEEQTTQWPKEKVQKDKQRSTKHTYKSKDRVKRTPLKTGGELRCSERVSIGYTRRRKTNQNTTQCVLDTTIRKQTQITGIRHSSSYKQLEVKRKRSSFLCGNRNGHHILMLKYNSFQKMFQYVYILRVFKLCRGPWKKYSFKCFNYSWGTLSSWL